ALCDREQPLHVRVALERRRQHPLGCRLTDFSLESLELHRREADQRSCSACLGVEGVRHPLGAERERASRQREGCVGNPEGQLALEDELTFWVADTSLSLTAGSFAFGPK